MKFQPVSRREVIWRSCTTNPHFGVRRARAAAQARGRPADCRPPNARARFFYTMKSSAGMGWKGQTAGRVDPPGSGGTRREGSSLREQSALGTDAGEAEGQYHSQNLLRRIQAGDKVQTKTGQSTGSRAKYQALAAFETAGYKWQLFWVEPDAFRGCSALKLRREARTKLEQNIGLTKEPE